MASDSVRFVTTWFEEVWKKRNLDADCVPLDRDHDASRRPTRRPGIRQACQRYRHVDRAPPRGKMVEGWNNWDIMSLMEQIEALTPHARLLPVG